MGFEKHGSSPGGEAKKGGSDKNNPNNLFSTHGLLGLLYLFILSQQFYVQNVINFI